VGWGQGTKTHFRKASLAMISVGQGPCLAFLNDMIQRKDKKALLLHYPWELRETRNQAYIANEREGIQSLALLARITRL
jgi:hypothetical protein